MNIDLTGKTALICGASSGIGEAIAYQFAECGAKLIVLARTHQKLAALKHKLDELNSLDNYYIAADLSNPEIAAMDVQSALSGPVDILVNNAGGPPPGPINKAQSEELKKAFDTHVVSAQKLTSIVLKDMMHNKWGRIINIISISVKQPVENLGVSNTIRGAMNSWSKTLSREVAASGVTVNNILPGFTATQRLENLFLAAANTKGISSDEAKQNVIKKIPAGRLGMPEEPAYLAAFLASDLASYINGVSIQVDGAYLETF